MPLELGRGSPRKKRAIGRTECRPAVALVVARRGGYRRCQRQPEARTSIRSVWPTAEGLHLFNVYYAVSVALAQFLSVANMVHPLELGGGLIPKFTGGPLRIFMQH